MPLAAPLVDRKRRGYEHSGPARKRMLTGSAARRGAEIRTNLDLRPAGMHRFGQVVVGHQGDSRISGKRRSLLQNVWY